MVSENTKKGTLGRFWVFFVQTDMFFLKEKRVIAKGWVSFLSGFLSFQSNIKFFSRMVCAESCHSPIHWSTLNTCKFFYNYKYNIYRN